MKKYSFMDGAFCPTSNTTSTPEQRNGGKCNPTTPDMNKDNPSSCQRQKKPCRGVKVDSAAKEKKDLGMFYLRNPSINPWTLSQRICPMSFALTSLAREKSETTLIVTLLTPGRLQSSNVRQSL
jgi:hypothetical protein